MKDDKELEPTTNASTKSGGAPCGVTNCVIRYSLLVAWMVVIWLFSAQPNSAEVTRGLFGESNFLVRKLAHFTEYAVLSVLGLASFSSHGANPPNSLLQKIGGRRAMQSAIILAISFAISDEIHQAFVPGRSAAIQDVLVDSAGAITAMLMVSWWQRRSSHGSSA